MRALNKLAYLLSLLIASISPALSTNIEQPFTAIKNFHFVSQNLASSGLIKMEDYTHIQKYGFKHVINLIPGEQSIERERVESLGMTYQQIEVEWAEPTLENFEQFTKLMNSYNNEKIYVHCEANYRASTFIYLYRIHKLKESHEIAQKDLLAVWKPSKTWQDFINKLEFYSEDK